MPRTAKRHNYVNFPRNSLKIKSVHLHIIPNHDIKLQDPSLNTFLRCLADKVKIPRIAKGHNYTNFPRNSLKIKSVHLHIIPNHDIKLQDPSLNTFLRCLADKVKIPRIAKVHNYTNFSFTEFSKNQISKSTHHSQSRYKTSRP